MDVSCREGTNPLKFMGFYLFPQGINKPAGCVPCWRAGVGATFSPPHVVTFPRTAGERELGFSIAGGTEAVEGWKAFYVDSIDPSGTAAQYGQLKEGEAETLLSSLGYS